MHGVFLHILGDAFGSIIVIINAVVNWKVDNEGLRKYLDPSLRLRNTTLWFSCDEVFYMVSVLVL